ncbi:putative membrane protein [Anaerotaenia torta]
MGFFFWLFSFLVWTFMPPSPIAFVFTPFYSLGELHGNIWSIIICFIPRILIGVVTGITHEFFSRRSLNNFFCYGISGVLGSLTSTFLVLAGIYFFFGHDYASVIGSSYSLLLGIIGITILTNGIPEAIIGGITGMAICRPLKILLLHRQ